MPVDRARGFLHASQKQASHGEWAPNTSIVTGHRSSNAMTLQIVVVRS